MCGIAGAISRTASAVNLPLLQQAGATLQHRGPDSSGHWMAEEGTAAFAHRRLSILDERACAAQPMPYLHYVIVHNGEIYNYLELKKDLAQKGYVFQTHTDTEVIAAAYDAYGYECLKKFDGAFAFAIWDKKKECLFAARDRFGEKPFFFFHDETQLLFASEMKALWKAGVAKEINPALLYNFLTIGYTSNPANPQETFYNNIYKLPAASFLTYAVATNTIRIEKYWQLQVSETKLSEAVAIAQFSELLSTSVRRRLRSDVAIGTSLSGGLDSSTLVALCAGEKATHYSHKCFTAVFPDYQKNEQAFAQQVAAQFGLQHFQIPISVTDLENEMDAVACHQEEPFGSASVVAQYVVFKKAKSEGVTVLLDGQGADEILAGYSKYYHWYWRQLYRQKMLAQSGELKAARAMGYLKSFGLSQKAAALLPEFTASMAQTLQTRKAATHPLLNADFRFANKRNLYYSLPTAPDLNGVLFFNTTVYGLEELLRYADRNSMAHGVEVRLPFLQHNLVEFLFSLPAHFKIRQGITKWLLRKSMDGKLAKNILWRSEKVGFEPPQKAWMQHKNVQEKIRAGKEKLVQDGILSTKALQQVKPTDAYAADNWDWRFWSASYL
ncbi:MAG TPA: asparagine synthase (glutamine-hydrolyzing) [Chitinophagaceae bacterium]|nr:asparagine synthase (glutamine-hydrolyzing) [Chitinophagaceae bacterium]